MKLKIVIDLDNAAFADGGTDEAIRCITEALEELRGRWAKHKGDTVHVRDIYGNYVGTAKISE